MATRLPVRWRASDQDTTHAALQNVYRQTGAKDTQDIRPVTSRGDWDGSGNSCAVGLKRMQLVGKVTICGARLEKSRTVCYIDKDAQRGKNQEPEPLNFFEGFSHVLLWHQNEK